MLTYGYSGLALNPRSGIFFEKIRPNINTFPISGKIQEEIDEKYEKALDLKHFNPVGQFISV